MATQPDVAFFLFNSDLISQEHGNCARYAFKALLAAISRLKAESPVVSQAVFQCIQGDLLGEKLLGDLARNVSGTGAIEMIDRRTDAALKKGQDFTTDFVIYTIGVWSDRPEVLGTIATHLAMQSTCGYLGCIRLGLPFTVEDFLMDVSRKLALPINILIARGTYVPDSRTVLYPEELQQLGFL